MRKLLILSVLPLFALAACSGHDKQQQPTQQSSNSTAPKLNTQSGSPAMSKSTGNSKTSVDINGGGMNNGSQKPGG